MNYIRIILASFLIFIILSIQPLMIIRNRSHNIIRKTPLEYRITLSFDSSSTHSDFDNLYFYDTYSDNEEPDGIRELAFLIIGIGDFLPSGAGSPPNDSPITDEPKALSQGDVSVDCAIAFRDGARRYWEKYKDYPGTDFDSMIIEDLIDNVWDDQNIITWEKIIERMNRLDAIVESDDRVVVYIVTHGDEDGNIYMGDNTAISPQTLAKALAEHFGDALDFIWVSTCYSSITIKKMAEYLSNYEIVYLGYSDILYVSNATNATESFWDRLYEYDFAVETWYEWYTKYYDPSWVMIDNWSGLLVMRYYENYYPPSAPSPSPPYPGPIPT
ncbi:MAG: hypothetical protein ACTSUJ_07010 [Candidatus Njordarchaeales archaeon]